MENNALLLKAVEEKVARCQACSLFKTANKAVPGEGNPDSKIFFIGEAPGFYEDQSGKPFVGRAGQLLEKTLNEVGLKRTDVFIGNVVKHRPPENRDPLPAEITACAQWLDHQLAIIRPKIIVTLGRFSMNKFMPGAKISYVHGAVRHIKDYIVIPMYHPAAALRSNEMMRAFVEDFKKNKDVLLNPDQKIVSDDSKEEKEGDPNQTSLF